jgi:hypothetical protein
MSLKGFPAVRFGAAYPDIDAVSGAEILDEMLISGAAFGDKEPLTNVIADIVKIGSLALAFHAMTLHDKASRPGLKNE